MNVDHSPRNVSGQITSREIPEKVCAGESARAAGALSEKCTHTRIYPRRARGSRHGGAREEAVARGGARGVARAALRVLAVQAEGSVVAVAPRGLLVGKMRSTKVRPRRRAASRGGRTAPAPKGQDLWYDGARRGSPGPSSLLDGVIVPPLALTSALAHLQRCAASCVYPP